jgi:ABC-type lipoprotein export system ATPase subunit
MSTSATALSSMDSANGLETCFDLSGVRKTYVAGPRAAASARPALSIDSLSIYGGQTTAVLGYSGSGKSTLLNLLSLLDVPDDNGGDIRYRGQSYREIRRIERAKNRLRSSAFGFVFQDNHLLEHFSSARNISLGMAMRGLPLGECDAKARQLLSDVGIASKVTSLPSELSGGEKQRVAVMRAIAHDPQVVFADEPTGNLDWDTGLAVMERLDRWRKETGRTLVVVSHNIHQIVDFADRFIMLKDGEVIFRGVHARCAGSRTEDEEEVDEAERLTSVLAAHSEMHAANRLRPR